jgi:hypothetical protein
MVAACPLPLGNRWRLQVPTVPKLDRVDDRVGIPAEALARICTHYFILYSNEMANLWAGAADPTMTAFDASLYFL